jgi:CubicO group peptidase (beta-lactamase class C family)
MRHWIPVLAALVLAAPSRGQSAEHGEFYYTAEKLGWDLTNQHKVPGVSIAVIEKGQVAWFLGCGFADLEAETDVTPQTIFNIGSISKTVAAWGLMDLVEEGVLELDAPIETYLTRWELPASEKYDKQGVTLRRLLSHTAGLSLHGYPGFEPGEELPSVEASLSGATNGSGGVHLIYAPGTSWKYSGGGFTIAQLVVEEVTGETFAEYMRERVLGPLGMAHSDYRWTEEIDRLAATPYDRAGAPIGGPRFTAQAAASLKTTAEELARFGVASLMRSENDVLEAATLQLMQSPVTSSPNYGLGYQLSDEGNQHTVGHGGANQGWMAQLTLVPDTGDGLVVLTNGSNGQYVIRPIEKAWREHLAARAGQ